ncbi:MAG TPA: hypothetical protein VIL03_03210 [Clostridia bacterium]|jgi:hypothetical protein
MTRVEEFKKTLNEVIALVEEELKKVAAGQSIWSQKQLEKIIQPEMMELLEHAKRGEILMKRNKKLRSTYFLVETNIPYDRTDLGKKILELQGIYQQF